MSRREKMTLMTPTMLHVTSILTGIFFFAWPLRMNQSGLPTAASIFVYSVPTFVVALVGLVLNPAARAALVGHPLSVGLQAGIFAALGMIVYAITLAHASPAQAPRQILIAIVTQTALNGLWAAYQAGGVEPRLMLGFASALATVFFLR